VEMLSGAEMVVRALQDEGVEYIFGYPGGSVLHIYDALFQQDKVSHILVRHEQAATHAADGYARATGKPGVVMVTSGPGATNAITGLATAFMDSIPMIVLSGQVRSDWIGDDAFQETDMIGVSRPVVKHSFMVRDAKDIPEIMKKAFYIATTGRPGPVLIDIPKDQTAPNVKNPYEYPKKVKMRSYAPVSRGHSGQIRKAVEELMKAKRPVIYAGGGVIQGEGSELLTKLAHRLNFPVTNTLMGLGCFPGTDPQNVGMLGMHGTYEANMTMHSSDVILAVGARLDDRVTNNVKKFCPGAKIIHIDIDPATISKNIMAHIPIVGPVHQVLEEMLSALDEHGGEPDQKALERWWEEIEGWRKVHGMRYETNENGPMKPQQVVEALYKATGGDAYVTSDVGQHQMFAAQYYKYDKPRRWINSGGLGTMGFSIPAAIGAKVAFPDRMVWAIDGDGCFQMTAQELVTATVEKIPIKVALLNNSYLGMVRQWQEMFYEERYSEVFLSKDVPNYKMWAESMGCVGIRVDDPEEVAPAIARANEINDRPVVIDFRVAAAEKVYPMVPSGATNSELMVPPSQQDLPR